MLLRHTSHYLFASAASAFFGLLSTVVFTRLLAPAEYGVYVVGVGAAGIISAVLFTWVRYAAMRFQSEGGQVDVRATVLIAYIVSAATAPLALAALVLICHFPLPQAICVVLFALGLGLFELGQELLKARLQTAPYVLASTLRCVAAFALCLTVAWLGGRGLGQLAMAALAYFVTSAVMARRIWRAPMAQIEWSRLGVFLTLGVSLTCSGFIFAFHSALDRLLVAWTLGDSAAGVYGASADLVRQVILVPTGSVAAAAVPLAVRAMAQGAPGAVGKQLEAGAELLLAILIPAVIGLALTGSYLVESLMGPAFRATAASIIPILCFAWLFQSITQSYIHLSFHLAKRPGLATAQGLVTLAVNAATIWPAIAAFGLPGAAASLVLAEGVGAAFGFALTKHAFPLPSIWRPLGRVGTAAGIMALALIGLEKCLPDRTLGSLALLIVGGVAVYGLAALALDIGELKSFLLAAQSDRRRAASRVREGVASG
jgi:O-antigen/teichoic acid export membrane protein